jgi:acetyl esterase/lipase
MRSEMSEEILDLVPRSSGVRLAYGEHPLQFGDLRLPQHPGPHPVVVMVHGGFWRARYDLVHIGHLCEALSAAGYATWNVEFRRIGNGGGWPHTFADVSRGMDHVRALADDYPLDLGRIVTLGHSAGGHLALWLAARGRLSPSSELSTVNPLLPTGVVSLAGVVDLRACWELRLGDGIVVDLLGGTPDEVPERYSQASPYDLLPLRVPHVLIHGTEDDSVPFSMSVRYVRRATGSGDEVSLATLEGMGHFEPIDPRSVAWPAVLAAVRSLLDC